MAFLRRRIANPKRQSVTTKFGQFRPNMKPMQGKQDMITDLTGDEAKATSDDNTEEAGLELAATTGVVEGPGPGGPSSRLWVDRGVVGVPAKRESRSTTPQPFALAEARRSFANVSKELEARSPSETRQSFAKMSKAMEVRSQSRAELSNEIAQRATARKSPSASS